MARILLFTCFVLLTLSKQQQPAEANPIIVAKTALKFALGLYEDIKEIQKYFAAPPTEDEKLTKTDSKMFEKLNGLSENIRDLREDLFNKISKDLQNKLTSKSNKLYKHVKDVQRLYKKFLNYAKNTKLLHRSTLDDFSHEVTTSSLHQLSATIEQMHEALTELDINNESILTILSNKTNPELMCIRNQSPQQVIHDLYKTVVFTDTKGLVVKLFAYEQKENAEKATYKFEKQQEIDDFTSRISETYSKVKDALATASREIWKCDPATHLKDLTYSKIQEVFQAFINFEADTPLDTCKQQCDDYVQQVSRCRSTFCKEQRKSRRCKGHLRDCKSIHDDKTVCHAPDDSDRRYLWLETASGTKYGQISNCKEEQHIVTEWHGAYRCEFCLCTCVNDHREIDRYFSLSEASSDILDNMVVTGIRLKKENHVFYIQIQQGHLGPNGTIDPSTVHWKPIEPEVTDLTEFAEYHYVPAPAYEDKYTYEEYVEFKKNPYIYSVNWEQKTVYLDDIEPHTSKNEVVTGLRFKQVKKDLRLEVETTPFDYTTGSLKGRSKWHFNSDPQESRTALLLDEADDPTHLNNHIQDSHSSQYVTFQITDLSKDLGQYTVPFVDIQEVVSNPPVPISGAGIFHKGAKGSGGFLALKLIQFDFTKHL